MAKIPPTSLAVSGILGVARCASKYDTVAQGFCKPENSESVCFIIVSVVFCLLSSLIKILCICYDVIQCRPKNATLMPCAVHHSTFGRGWLAQNNCKKNRIFFVVLVPQSTKIQQLEGNLRYPIYDPLYGRPLPASALMFYPHYCFYFTIQYKNSLFHTVSYHCIQDKQKSPITHTLFVMKFCR